MNQRFSINGRTVLHVLDRSLPNLSGYSIRSRYIVEFQSQMGLKPVVMTTPKYEREKPFEQINGIEYHRSYAKPESLQKILYRIPFLREQAMMRRAQNMIEELVRANKVDIIHAHSPSLCGLPALKAARRLNVPMVYEVRAFWEDAAVDQMRFAEDSFRYRISSRMEQKLFDRADGVVCICEGLRQEISRRAPGRKISVVQNGVNTSFFVPREKSRDLMQRYQTQGKTVVGFIGSFFTFEGLADLVHSIARIKKEIKDVVLLLVGTGIEDQNLRNLAHELGLNGNSAIFTGKVPHEEVQDYYSIMDILVYPRISKRITELVTPLKPLEAMAMEKTVLVSDVGGLRELVSEGQNGFVYQAGNVHDLAEKLVYLAGNPEHCREIGRRARQDMEKYRDWSVISREYESIYSELLNGK